MRYRTVLWLWLAPLCTFANEQLLVFFHDDGSPAARYFAKETLPFVKELAAAEQIELERIAPHEGAPAEVTISPLIAFQNHRGRSIYQGRTTTPERIRTFIETARWVPQTDEALLREDVIARQLGRTTIASPVKIAPVSGTRPRGYDEAVFQAEMRKAIAKGLRHSRFVPRLEQGRSDRAFYMDFYPWVSDKGELYLSYALFSQFHCKKAVYFSSEEEKLSGSWRKRGRLFQEAATRLEAEVQNQCTRDEGDGFVPVPASAPTHAWPPLPDPPADVPQATGTVTLVREWTVDSEAEGPPPILFQFPAPIDQYRGKLTEVRGTLNLAEDLAIDSLTGSFWANPKTIDMGESDLNDALQGKSFLNTGTFPDARFTIDRVESDYRLAFGTLATFTMEGRFELKGKTVPLTIVGDIEPTLQRTAPRLRFRSTWALDFSSWKIEAADGPAPQRHTLHFDLNAVLKPTATPR